MKAKHLLTAGLLLLGFSATAQLKIGDNPTSINANSVLEVESTDRGLLLPRVALTGTANFTPLAAHVAGMTVYNTATAGNVTPGYYYNNGSNWVRIGDASTPGPTGPAGPTGATGPAGSNATVTASNGLTAAAGNVTLGGTLTAATTITQGFNNVTFTGVAPILKLTGTVSAASSIGLGRTGVEAVLEVASSVNQPFPGVEPGDLVLSDSRSIIIGSRDYYSTSIVANGARRLTVTRDGNVDIGQSQNTTALGSESRLRVDGVVANSMRTIPSNGVMYHQYELATTYFLNSGTGTFYFDTSVDTSVSSSRFAGQTVHLVNRNRRVVGNSDLLTTYSFHLEYPDGTDFNGLDGNSAATFVCDNAGGWVLVQLNTF